MLWGKIYLIQGLETSIRPTKKVISDFSQHFAYEKETTNQLFSSVQKKLRYISFLITFQKIKGEVFPEGIHLYQTKLLMQLVLPFDPDWILFYLKFWPQQPSYFFEHPILPNAWMEQKRASMTSYFVLGGVNAPKCRWQRGIPNGNSNPIRRNP